jgi:8-oxo-dGTP pyrophosphatase MutT (NUDIX family)
MDSSRRQGYVRAMRSKIGHQLLLLPGVTLLVFDEAGRMLMVEQADRKLWSTPGGAIEPGESPRQAAVREAWEETGLTVELTELVDVLGGTGFEMVYPNGDVCAYVSIVFRARVIAGELSADGVEISRCGWIAPEALGDLDLVDFTRTLLSHVGLV